MLVYIYVLKVLLELLLINLKSLVHALLKIFANLFTWHTMLKLFVVQSIVSQIVLVVTGRVLHLFERCLGIVHKLIHLGWVLGVLGRVAAFGRGTTADVGL